MASTLAAQTSKTVILSTGGTIAGRAAGSADNVSYRAGVVSPEQLVAAVAALQAVPLEVQDLAQVDSKDMTHALWCQLTAAVTQALARADVGGVVVTHGTDTLEETAYWLHRTVPAYKPVVLTAAMRPASSLQADGPQNLLDAVTVARSGGYGAGVSGVVVVIAGKVHAGHEIRKVHNYRVDAFSSGDAGPLALLEEGRLRVLRPWPNAQPAAVDWASMDADHWPWVELVSSHAGASRRAVDALVNAGVQGLVVSATGNGSVHRALLGALEDAAQRGVKVLRATRCALGTLVDDGQALEGAGGLTPAQARVELMLRLLSKPKP